MVRAHQFVSLALFFIFTVFVLVDASQTKGCKSPWNPDSKPDESKPEEGGPEEGGPEEGGADGDPPVQSGHIDINGKTYFFDSSEFTWYAAMEICHSMNMSMVSFETQEEQRLVNQWFESNTDYTNLPIWSSGTTKSMDDRWFWASSGQTITEFNWTEGYPQHEIAEHSCIVFLVNSGGWHDLLCEDLDSNYPAMMCE